MTPGRKAAIAAGIAGGLAGIGAIGAWLAVPEMVRDEVVSRAEARGLHCSIAAAQVGLGELVLRDVQLRDESGALEARIEEIALDAGLLAIAARGTDAIASVVVRGGEIRIDTSSPGIAESIARLRGSSATTGYPAGERRERELRLEGVGASVRDEYGELVVVRELHAGVTLGRFSVRGLDVAIAPGAAESTRIDEARLEGSLVDRHVDRLEAGGVLLEVADADADGEAGVVARAQSARRAIFGDDEDDAERDAEADEAPGGPLRFFGPSFGAHLERLTVRRRTPDGARDVLTGLEVELSREGPDVLRTRGEGRPDHGGRLVWDLRMEPLALRAVGSIQLEEVAVAVIEPLLPAELPLHRPEDARLDGALRIEGQGDALHATGRLAVRELALSSPRIAPGVISGIALGLQGEATFRPEQRRLEIANLTVESGAAHIDVEGAIEWTPEHYLFDLEATLPTTRCGDAVSAIPRDLLQEMAAFSFTGEMGGHLAVHVDSRDLDATRLAIRVANACRFETVPELANLARFQGPFVHRVVEPDGTTFEMTTGPGTEPWTEIAEISPFMLHAVLGHEDGGFFRHGGFSTGSIRGALVRNLRAGRYVMGASTISMQLVKNVFLRREKTLARKVQEVLLTWWIESAWSKEQILELYLNVIEYGPGVYGIRNAAWHYFGVLPSELTPAQTAYLATILPNPKLYHSHRAQGALPESWIARLSRFARVLGERERFDEAAVNDAVHELAAFQFHRDGEPPPAPRHFVGQTSPLPIAGAADDASEVIWDEALDGVVADPGEAGYE